MTTMHPSPLDEDPLPADEPAVWLSALADGQAWAVPQALRHWRDDPEARRTWHAYQLIGDALRSDELAQPASRDHALLDRIRRRLDDEPVVLAPATAARPADVRGETPRAAAPRWAVPAGLAAVLVLGTAWVVSSRDDGVGTTVAGGGAPARAVGTAPAPVAVAAAPARPAQVVGGDGVIRDPRLEEFLRVHQSARGGVATPGGGLRRVDAWSASSPSRPVAP